MLSVQSLENAVSTYWLVANTQPEMKSNASISRQWRNAFVRAQKAFQTGSAGMRINDAKSGIKPFLASDVYEDLDDFFKVVRNRLAHRYLVERAAAIANGGKQELAGSAAELIQVHQRATRLTNSLHESIGALIDTWPSPDVPPEVSDVVEATFKSIVLNQIPLDASAAGESLRQIEIDRTV